jgi:flagellar hook-associated protein 2
MKTSDKFSITATAGGAAGQIKLEGDDAEMLFGVKGTDYDVVDGQDAVISVKYAGSNEVVDLIRGSNNFNMDGLSVTISGTFGDYDPVTGKLNEDPTQAVTFEGKTDNDKIVSALSDMVKDYNDIIDLVYNQLTTKPDRDYFPLTAEQKDQMSEDQVKQWEEQAKKGMLFNDSDLRGLSDSLRFILDSGSSDKSMLESFGISTSTNYGDNGKLVFNEAKFREALDAHGEDLQKLFTKTADSMAGSKGGVMSRISDITNKYAATTGATKGILIEKAGSIYAPTSIMNNYLQKSIDGINDVVKRLQGQLKTETDRYIKQFTTLESLISQMNSQSSWLSSFGA